MSDSISPNDQAKLQSAVNWLEARFLEAGSNHPLVPQERFHDYLISIDAPIAAIVGVCIAKSWIERAQIVVTTGPIGTFNPNALQSLAGSATAKPAYRILPTVGQELTVQRGTGSFSAQRALAAAEADEAHSQEPTCDSPELATLACNVRGAFHFAVELAKASRASSSVDPISFVGHVVRLSEYQKRLKPLISQSDLLNAWPKTPGTNFSWKGGDSALHVAIQFAQMIEAAVRVGRVHAIEFISVDNLPVAPDCDQHFSKWRDATIAELQSRTLPTLPAWSMHEIHKEVAALQSKLRDESRRMQGNCHVPATAAQGAQAAAAATPGKVFISYSHKDKRFLEQLLTHLKPLERAGRLSYWSDEQIRPSSKWFPEIKNALAQTQVAMLLVTPDFLASDFIHEHELTPLLKEAERGGVRILWVPIKASSYTATPIAAYQAIGSPNKPLAAMTVPKRDLAWVRVCEELSKAVE